MAFLQPGVTIGDLVAALTPAARTSLTLSDVTESIPALRTRTRSPTPSS